MSASADALIRAGLGTRYTAAVLRVECNGSLRFERAYGTLDDAPDAAATFLDTRFDLASLTKVFVATAVLGALADDLLALDEPLVRWFPQWRVSAHASIVLRDLLAHTSGMASGADYRTLLDEDVEGFAQQQPLVARPRERVIYSDLGFIVLGTLLGRVRGCAPGNAIAHALRAMGCRATDYRPRGDGAAEVPATELDGWRGRVRGRVHDEKAYLMNGVAGHAGLFGTARDVAALAEIYLGSVHARRPNYLPPPLARAALVEVGPDPLLRRGLGWALKTSDANSCGAVMSRASFGHTGFTGTAVWADPMCDLSVVLLTNALFYGRHDLRDLRAAVCDAAVAEFGT